MVVEVHLVVEKYHAKRFQYSKNKILNYVARFCNAVSTSIDEDTTIQYDMKVTRLAIASLPFVTFSGKPEVCEYT